MLKRVHQHACGMVRCLGCHSDKPVYSQEELHFGKIKCFTVATTADYLFQGPIIKSCTTFQQFWKGVRELDGALKVVPPRKKVKNHEAALIVLRQFWFMTKPNFLLYLSLYYVEASKEFYQCCLQCLDLDPSLSLCNIMPSNAANPYWQIVK